MKTSLQELCGNHNSICAWRRGSVWIFAATSIALLIAGSAFGGLTTIFSDNFDSETAGTTPPAGWLTFGGSSVTILDVYNGESLTPGPGGATPSSPNVFRLYDPGISQGGTPAQGYIAETPMPNTPLLLGHTYTLSFDFRFDYFATATAGSAFWNWSLATPSSFLATSNIEFRASSSVDGSHYQINYFDPPTYAEPTIYTGLQTGQWYNLQFQIHLTNTTTLAGYGEYFLDNTLIANEPFTLTPTTTNINFFVTGDTRYYDSVGFLDNLQFTDFVPDAIPEPSALLPLGAGVVLFWQARRGRKG